MHCCAIAFAAPTAECEAVDEGRFEKQVVASGCKDAVQMDISTDGHLVFIERTGAVRLSCESNTRSKLRSFPPLTSAPAAAFVQAHIRRRIS
jgi:hypothetical protein